MNKNKTVLSLGVDFGSSGEPSKNVSAGIYRGIVRHDSRFSPA